MPAPVRLNGIVEALEIQRDESSSFLDRHTGEVETVSHDLLRLAEEPAEPDIPEWQEDLPEWQAEEWEVAKRIVSTGRVVPPGRFLELPTKFDVHEWEIMQTFAGSVEPASIREELLSAIHGAKAFRGFKDAVRRRGIESDWFAFRSEALRRIAIDWCEEHHAGWE